MTEAQPVQRAEERPKAEPTKAPESSEDTTSEISKESATAIAKEDIFYAFGRDNYFCLWGPEVGWNIWTSTAGIAAYKKLQLATLYGIALTPEGDWIVTGEDKYCAPVVAYWDVKTGCVPVNEAKAWTEAHEGYQKLFDQLCKDGDEVAKLEKARFVVGPAGSWWAKTSTGTHSHNLPPALHAKIQTESKRDVHPHHVALGHHGSYAVLWSDDTRSWSLTGYEAASKALESDKGVDYISLSPMTDEHFIVTASGATNYSISNSRDDQNSPGYLDKQTRAYTQRRVWQTGEEVQYDRFGPNIPTQQVIISPSTNYTYEPSTHSPIFSATISFPLTRWASRFLPTWNWNWPTTISTTMMAAGAGAAAAAIPIYCFCKHRYRHTNADNFARMRQLVQRRQNWRGWRSVLFNGGLVAAGGASNLIWTRWREARRESNSTE